AAPLHWPGGHRAPHSFPTRRSSDLADLGGDRAEVRRAAAVDADALVHDAGADDVLEHRLDGVADLLVATGELLGQLLADLGLDEIGRATSELQSRENLVCRLLLEKK